MAQWLQALSQVSFPDLDSPAAGWALFLDLDGTLLDLAATPQGVTVPPGLSLSLARAAAALGGALALVSGRPLAQIDRLLAPLRLPVSGQHGRELRRTAKGPVGVVNAPVADSTLRRRLGVLVASCPGALLEDKGLTLAVHTRLAAPGSHRALEAALRSLTSAHRPPLEIFPGKEVWEIRAAGASKATAVDAFLTLPPFAGRRPVFVGDDRSDREGFLAASRRGGLALPVGDAGAPAWPPAFSGPAAVRAWLAGLPDRITTQGALWP